MTPVLVGLILTELRIMLEFFEIQPATMKNAAEEISLGTSMLHPLSEPPHNTEILLFDVVTSYPKPLSILSV